MPPEDAKNQEAKTRRREKESRREEDGMKTEKDGREDNRRDPRSRQIDFIRTRRQEYKILDLVKST